MLKDLPVQSKKRRSRKTSACIQFIKMHISAKTRVHEMAAAPLLMHGHSTEA